MNDNKKQNNIEEQILQRISEDHIKPKPKWEFLLTNCVFWFLGALTVIFGAFAVAASDFVFRNIRWEFYEETHDSFFVFLVEFLPYLWIILFIVFMIFTHNLIKRTKHGYKYNFKLILGATLIASVVFGMFLSHLGFGKFLDEEIGERVPFNLGIKKHNYVVWNNPDRGLLVGNIRPSDLEEKLILTNTKGQNWNLIVDDLDKMSADLLHSGEIVRVIGVKEGENFHVCLVLPDFGAFKNNAETRKYIFERKDLLVRSNECEAIRPYKILLEN